MSAVSLQFWQDRVRGVIYGLAVTDSLGAPVEFQARHSFKPVTQPRYIAHFDLPAGSWTDDTSLALCVAASLAAHNGGCNVRDQVGRYDRWLKNGYLSSVPGKPAFDVGNATRAAIGIWADGLAVGAMTETIQRRIDARLGGESSCGNGSLMRIAPLGILAAALMQRNGDKTGQDRLIQRARIESRVDELTRLVGQSTHPHLVCIETCQVYVRMLTHAMERSCKMAHEDKGLEDWPQKAQDDIFNIFHSFPFRTSPLISLLDKYPDVQTMRTTLESNISSSGYVVHTFEAALWAFVSTTTFRDGALLVVNLGDDADTVGAVYGGLAGACYGETAIPAEWLSLLAQRDTVEAVVQDLIHMTETVDISAVI